MADRYVRGIQEPLHLVAKEMNTNLGYGNFIFVGSSCDMFADDIPDEWIMPVIEYAHSFKNRYLFQTKNPTRFASPLFGLSANKDTLCTTIETNFFIPEIMKGSPPPEHRSIAMEKASDMGFRTMISIEPIIDFNLWKLLFFIERARPEQVNIGADTGNHRLPEPTSDKILELITRLKTFTHVVEKKNLRRLLK
jgi:DNA repair photolyase